MKSDSPFRRIFILLVLLAPCLVFPAVICARDAARAPAAGGAPGPLDFKAQNDYSRVRRARENRHDIIRTMFSQAGVAYPAQAVFLRVFKNDKELELWVKPNIESTQYILLKTYKICAGSGHLGPKRIEGDGQVPEGGYVVANFNPTSNFHLSLGLDYPNKSDRILSDQNHPGGEIFIHGACVTIGCVPITDEFIEEVYLIALDSKAQKSRIPVHVFPTRMNEAGMALLKQYAADYEARYHGGKGDALWKFWSNLKPLYDAFEKTKIPPKFTVDARGGYVVGP